MDAPDVFGKSRDNATTITVKNSSENMSFLPKINSPHFFESIGFQEYVGAFFLFGKRDLVTEMFNLSCKLIDVKCFDFQEQSANIALNFCLLLDLLVHERDNVIISQTKVSMEY